MVDTGWKLPGTASQDTNLGNTSWSAPSNILLPDGIYANYSGAKFDGNDVEDGPSLKATNFSFTIPIGATITGIETKIIGGGNHVGEVAYLTQLGSPSIFPYGSEKRNTWPLVFDKTTYVYGSSEDLWGTYDLTPSIVNASNFGWVYMIYDASNPLSASIDSMQMKIYYDLPQTAGLMGAGF